MSKIKIRDFGPIGEGLIGNEGWIEIKKTTVFTGNQGSGKSTVAKLISTISWIEKAIIRGDLFLNELSQPGGFEEICEYQNISYYFKNSTEILYRGEYINFSFSHGQTVVEELKVDKYNLPKIMYVPADRNIVGSVSNVFDLKGLPGTLYTFATEYRNALDDIVGMLNLPINNAKLSYDRSTKTASVVGKNFSVPLIYASSGFHSFVPLYVVSKFLSQKLLVQRHNRLHNGHADRSIEMEQRLREEIKSIREDPNKSATVKQYEIELAASKFEYNAYINIVEEPEQNLFPTSQRSMLNSLLEFNNLLKLNKLIMTTHSPYLINYLTLAAKAGSMIDQDSSIEYTSRIDKIVPISSVVLPQQLIIYELDEQTGTISELGTYHDLPSDENQLNEELGDFNDYYAHLIQIEKSSR